MLLPYPGDVTGCWKTPPFPGSHFHLLSLFLLLLSQPSSPPPFPPPLLSCISGGLGVIINGGLTLSPQSYHFIQAWIWSLMKQSLNMNTGKIKLFSWLERCCCISFIWKKQCRKELNHWVGGIPSHSLWPVSPLPALSPHHLEVSNRLPLWQPGAISWLKSLRNFTGLFPGPEVDLVTLGL